MKEINETIIGEDYKRQEKKRTLAFVAFVLTGAMLIVLIFAAINLGSLKVSTGDIIAGILGEEGNGKTAVDLRLPRLLISIFAGSAIAVSGTMLQAVLKNPLADPGIIGISGGAGMFATLAMAIFPSLYFALPIIAFLGGVFGFFLVYTLSWKGGLSPMRIILTGVAISAMFSGLSTTFAGMKGELRSGVAAIVDGNIAQKTWDDIYILLPYVISGLFLAFIFVRECNLLSLEDRTARSLGINVNKTRIIISLIAVLLASIATAVAGAISFLGLIVPHIGRILVGSNHRVLIPFSAIGGGFVLLLADTVGRTIASPYEVGAGIIMSVAGGPFFVLLLRRARKYGN